MQSDRLPSLYATARLELLSPSDFFYCGILSSCPRIPLEVAFDDLHHLLQLQFPSLQTMLLSTFLLWQPEKLAQICASRSLPRPVGRDRRESTQHQFRCELVAFSADGRRARNLAQGHRRPLRRPAFRCLHRRLCHLQPPLRLRPDRVLCMSDQTLLWVIVLPNFGAVRMVLRCGVLLHHGTQPGINLQLSLHRWPLGPFHPSTTRGRFLRHHR